jgi:hypothetical protein
MPVLSPSQGGEDRGRGEHDRHAPDVHGAGARMTPRTLARGRRERSGHDRGESGGDVNREGRQEHRPVVGHLDTQEPETLHGGRQHVAKDSNATCREATLSLRYVDEARGLRSQLRPRIVGK